MLSLNDITNVSFRKAGFSGYRTDDVDTFIDQVRDTVEELIQKNQALRDEVAKEKEQNSQMQKKVEILAAKIEEYRSEEDEIKNALVSAQKLGDASIREARHKAEIILKDATLKAEHIVSGAEGQIKDQKQQLQNLRAQVSNFRSHLLDLYRQHLTLINALPKEEEPEKQQPEQPAPAEEQVPAEEGGMHLEPSLFTDRAAPDPESVQEPTLEFKAGVSNFDTF